jgi:hypothetical protein
LLSYPIPRLPYHQIRSWRRGKEEERGGRISGEKEKMREGNKRREEMRGKKDMGNEKRGEIVTRRDRGVRDQETLSYTLQHSTLQFSTIQYVPPPVRSRSTTLL